MQGVLVDTDIAIDYLRGLPYANDLMEKLWESDSARLSILSVYELFAGMRDAEQEATGDFIRACPIEEVTFMIAQKGGEIYRHYRGQGITLTSADCLIQATAIIKGHKIATRNKAHYPDKRVISSHLLFRAKREISVRRDESLTTRSRNKG